jgi:hypothetical protein
MPGGVAQIEGMLRTGGLKSVFCLNGEIVPVCNVLRKYADVLMPLADACLVRMSELYPKHRVLTLDSDFLCLPPQTNMTIRTRNTAPAAILDTAGLTATETLL